MRIMPNKWLVICGLLVIMLVQLPAQAQSATDWTKEKAAAWFSNPTWLNGLKSKPSDRTNQQEFAKQYAGNKAAWDKAFAFLRDTDFTRLRIGKYPIDDDNVFATVSEGPPREISDAKWEFHHTYNDIHFVVKGKEKIGIMPVGDLPIAEAFSDAKDIGFYKIEGGNFYEAEPGLFYIITTKEAHNPGNHVEGYDGVKKVVIKVKNAQ